MFYWFQQTWKKYSCKYITIFSSLLTNTVVVVHTRRQKRWEMNCSMLFLLGGGPVCTHLGLNVKLKLLVLRETFTTCKKTHQKAISMWAMYDPRWRIPETLSQSASNEEVRQLIGQPDDDNVIRRTRDQTTNFFARFLLGSIVTFAIMFIIQKLFQVCSSVIGVCYALHMCYFLEKIVA